MGSGLEAPQPSGALATRFHAAVDEEPLNGRGTKRSCRSVDELGDCGEMGKRSTRQIGRSNGVDGPGAVETGTEQAHGAGFRVRLPTRYVAARARR